MATGVLKVRVGGSWIPIGASGSLPAHAVMHMAGGADAIALDTLAAPTDVTTLNATASAHGLLPKLSGNAATFLNGIGAWVTPSGSVSGPGSSIANDLAMFADATGKVLQDTGIPYDKVARLDRSNTFAGTITSQGLTINMTTNATFNFFQSDAAVDRKYMQIYTGAQVMTFRGVNDAFSAQLGAMTFNGTDGTLTVGGQVSAAGNAVIIGNPDGSWPGLKFNNTYFTINHPTGGQLAWFHNSGIFNLSTGFFRFSSTLLSVQNNAGTAMMTVRNDGLVSCPNYLVIPFGTDRWAPA